MRKLFFACTFLFLSTLVAFGQSQNISNCPTIKLSVSDEEIVDEGKSITIHAILDENVKKELKFKWRMLPAVSFKNDSAWSLQFQPPYELQEKTIKVIFEVEGLPTSCNNVSSKEFKVRIQILCRLPITIDEYERTSSKDEKVRLNAAVIGLNNSLKENEYSTLLFYVYSKNDFEFKKTKNSISNHLKNSKKVLPENFALVDVRDLEIIKTRVRIYLIPEKYSPPEK